MSSPSGIAFVYFLRPIGVVAASPQSEPEASAA
jgi:hypothetical protein